MSCEIIDLRSDTVTRPCPAMRQAMAQAEVGDDVIGSDPTVEALQEEIAAVLGKESAIFMPSGTMTNQIAIRIHCKPGDEFLCEEGCHIYNYEQGAFAQLSGVVARPIRGTRGVLNRVDLEGMVRPLNEHMVRTRMLCLENTHNRAVGRVQPYETVKDACAWAKSSGLTTHLDGARLFNAVVATGLPAADWALHFDSVSICFSKGLGAPVGSALVGSRELVREARWHRKAFGGGMRQVGIVAAGALYALRHNVARLDEDHEKARILAHAIRGAAGLTLVDDDVESNILIFSVDHQTPSAAEFARMLEQYGVRVLTTSSKHVRIVTHLDISFDQTHRAAEILTTVSDRFEVAQATHSAN